MEKPLSVKLLVTDANDLREALPHSGLFDMTDCTVMIDCPLDSDAEEVRKMVTILESAIHVVDVTVVGHVIHEGPEYMVEIVEIPLDIAEGRKRKF